MALIVQKFGGSSVADTARIRNVARIITETYRKGNNVVVVLSAQGDTTDDLIAKAEEINPGASRREMDMLLATGEQISISLCAMAIEALGYPVISLTGWQAGMLTNSAYGSARIKRIRTDRIQTELDARDTDRAKALLEEHREAIGFREIEVNEQVAKVSIVGAGMVNNPGVAARMFEALYGASVNINMISTSEIKVSVLVNERDADRAVQAIHDRFFNEFGGNA